MFDTKVVQKNTIKKELELWNNISCHIYYTNQPLSYKFNNVLSTYTGLHFSIVKSPLKNKKLLIWTIDKSHLLDIEKIIDTLRDFKYKNPELNMEIKLFVDKQVNNDIELFKTNDVFWFTAEELGFVKRINYKFLKWNVILQDLSEYTIIQKKDFLNLFQEGYFIKSIEVKNIWDYVIIFELNPEKKGTKRTDFIIVYEQNWNLYSENLEPIDKDSLFQNNNLLLVNEYEVKEWWKILFLLNTK